MFIVNLTKFFIFVSDGHEAYLEHAVELLDQDLRPVPPQPNCPESMQVYEEHRMVNLNEPKLNTIQIYKLGHVLFKHYRFFEF